MRVNTGIYFEDKLYGYCNDDGDLILFLESLPIDNHYNSWCLRSSGVSRPVVRQPVTEHLIPKEGRFQQNRFII